MVLDAKQVVIDWSLEGFCATHHTQSILTNTEQWTRMHPSSIDFLTKLDLPLEHPFCSHPQSTLLHPLAPPMGPSSTFKDSTMWEGLVTAFWYHVTPVAAFTYLNAVLIAIYVAPILIIGLMARIILSSHRYKDNTKKLNVVWTLHTELLFHATLFFTWLVLTDDQYVLEIGRGLGTCLAGLLLLIAVAMLTLKLSRPMFIYRVILVLLLCSMISPWAILDTEEIRMNLKPGLYYNHNNTPIRSTVEHWQRTLPDYDQVATPWQFTGDARTGVPYLMNLPPSPDFYRVWMPTVDQEYVALDIAFPEHGHNASNPLYLVLHGLNGGSQEGYVLDLVNSRTQAGSTVVVMVARGLMDTPIQGWTIFNGIRVSDIHSVATTLRERVLDADQTLAGIGYSMGGIVLNRYVSTEPNVALDVSVSISGALCTLHQMKYHRSQKTWQTVITGHMKEMFFNGKWGQRLHQFLGHQGYQRLLRAQTIVETDRLLSEMYLGYDNLTQFYTDMSAVIPDQDSQISRNTVCTGSCTSRRQIPIPHLVLQAFDDPLSTWRNNAADDPTSLLFPTNLVTDNAQKNVVVLLTAKGGHVGWPIGWWPHSWEFMNDFVAAGFVTAWNEQIQNPDPTLFPSIMDPNVNDTTMSGRASQKKNDCRDK